MAARKAASQELDRDHVIRTVRELFGRDGYHAVSMRAIASALGFTPGAFYYHFKNKEELFMLVVADDFHTLDRLLDTVLAQFKATPEKILEHILLGFIEFGLTNRHSFELMFLMHMEHMYEDCEGAPNNSYARFSDAVRSTPQFADVSPEQADAAVLALFISIRGFVAFFIRHPATFADLKPLALTQVRMLIRGI